MVRAVPVVVIAGASSGIGRATALRFARAGASVVLASRRQDALAELAAECELLGAQALAVATDVSDADDVAALGRRAVQEFGRIDVWVNVAGIAVIALFDDVPADDFRRVIDVNLFGTVHGAAPALAVFKQQHSGVLINVASLLGQVPQPYTSAYVMSKAAVIALGVSLRGELALLHEKKIHVVTVLPATIDTPFFRHAANYTGRKAVAMPPLYSPDLVARKIVASVRSPKAEIVIGALGKAVARQHRRTPRPVEAEMAVQTDMMQLSHVASAPMSAGTIYEPAVDLADATVTGGWHGTARTRLRWVVGGAATAAVVVAVSKKVRA